MKILKLTNNEYSKESTIIGNSDNDIYKSYLKIVKFENQSIISKFLMLEYWNKIKSSISNYYEIGKE